LKRSSKVGSGMRFSAGWRKFSEWVDDLGVYTNVTRIAGTLDVLAFLASSKINKLCRINAYSNRGSNPCRGATTSISNSRPHFVDSIGAFRNRAVISNIRCEL
jgi:hypothetical protein